MAARRAVLQSLGRVLTLSRGVAREVEGEDGARGSRSFAVMGGFASYHVRVKDVKEYFQRQEMKRKRRLGLQLEIIFLCFFFPLCVYWNAMFGQISQAAEILSSKPFPAVPLFNQTANLASTLTTFDEGIAGSEQFWQWMNNVVYQEIFVNGKCGMTVGDGGASRVIPNNTQIPIVAGQIRLRQVRVTASSCPSAASKMNITCYPPFEDKYESTRPITSAFNLTGGMRFQTAASTEEQDFPGEFATYPGSGFVVNFTTGAFPGNACVTDSQLARIPFILIPKTPFIDPSTRVLILTLTTFAPNSGALVTTRFAVETSFSGFYRTSYLNQGVSYFRTSSSWLTMQVLTIFVVVIECVFAITSLWGIIFGWEIESTSWTLADLVTSALMMYQMYLLLSMFFVSDFYNGFENTINKRSDGFWSGTGFYPGVEVSLMVNLQSTNSLILMFSVFRLFRYSQYLDTMQVIHGTIRRTWTDILMYFFLLLLLSLGYVLCGMVVLSSYLQAWSSYPSGVYTLTQYFVLIIDYYSMAGIKPLGPYIAPIFLVTFIFIFTWYMFAVFLAVIYVGYRGERSMSDYLKQKRTQWERFAEDNGAICIVNDERFALALSSSTQTTDGDDDDGGGAQGGGDTNSSGIGKAASSSYSSSPAGILTRKSFFYSSWKETILEHLRMLIGLPERSGFFEYSTIIRAVTDYEDKWLKQNLPNLPAKRYLISYSELMDIVNGKTVDLIEELRRVSQDATAAEEYRRTHGGRATGEEMQRTTGRGGERFEGGGDRYLDSMDPMEIQFARLFRELWIIPDDKLEAFAKMETDESAGQLKRLLLVRIQDAMRKLDERETESSTMIGNKIRSLRVVQKTMERDVRALRELLK